MLSKVLLQCPTTLWKMISASLSGDFFINVGIPMIFGVNIGTRLFNLMIALLFFKDRTRFGTVFAAATLSDVYNWTILLFLFPIEVGKMFNFVSYRHRVQPNHSRNCY